MKNVSYQSWTKTICQSTRRKGGNPAELGGEERCSTQARLLSHFDEKVMRRKDVLAPMRSLLRIPIALACIADPKGGGPPHI